LKIEKKKPKRQVSAVSCPECKGGTAVNKREAYRAFHSKKYSRRRKTINSAPQRRMSQVSKETSIEYLLTDPLFAKSAPPPKLLLDDDYFIPKRPSTERFFRQTKTIRPNLALFEMRASVG